MGISTEVWFRDTKDQRQVQQLNLLDIDSHEGHKIKQTMDYTPSKEESESLDLSKLDMVPLLIGVSEIRAATGGRIKILGRIDLTSVPKQALRVSAQPVKA